MSKKQADRSVDLEINGHKRHFDIDDPDLPGWVTKNAFTSENYPYEEKLDRDDYNEQIRALQIELVKVQAWQQKTGERVIIVFEGRDAAGKGGSIAATRAYMNPRMVRIVALPKPTERERGQWYYQRYVDHFPTSGEMVLFDRSWYNRAGVEPVMGFCTPEQHERFLGETPDFEHMPVREGIHLFKFWLNIGQEMQLKRFHDRRHNPLKVWKLSPMDIASLQKWGDYTQKRDLMLEHTHSNHAPWTVVRANDKRRARLNLIRHLLTRLPYEGKDAGAIGKIDERILGSGPGFLVD
ncbi:polyphosphate kinase 2 [Hoeflea prorocentri]|uniref:ADP/GDP-polyphosphate phosphotransferase n=1 Tax=Hoeflea prorocentri TaxID=1922333 RepID=A0A9X3UKN6_9HYPH|nr:polyphosphate kinase 2 [Hoeflea prorocentri]MCY6382585.1 polyphosphate kinase 2 [Hoeflea prorocentri]MDA5400385.1 polyphosphate kinase 2 [Hoeflea prorocentri]